MTETVVIPAPVVNTVELGGATVTVTEESVSVVTAGTQGPEGAQGSAGATGEQGPAGPGVAAGGSTGQILKKASNADYDTAWQDESGAVLSVFGRTGTVTAQSGDYAIGQISGVAAVASTNSYNDLSNLPTLGDLAALDLVTVSEIDATGTPSISTYLRGDGSWSTVTSGVSSVFGRTGAVTAQSGDYTKAQVGLGNVVDALQLQAANNLSDLASVSTARTNLGLGTLATLSSVNLAAQVTGILPVANGGTNLSALGTANQVLGVNSGASALEYKTVTAGANISVTHGAGSITLAVTAAGSSGQLQFNNAGSLGASSGMAWQSGASPNLAITAQNAAHAPLAVIGAASQTANLQDWRNSGGTTLAAIDASGFLVIGTGTAVAQELIRAGSYRLIHTSGGITNFFAGVLSGTTTISGTGNVGIGVSSMRSSTTSLNTTCVGADSGRLGTNLQSCTFIGAAAGYSAGSSGGTASAAVLIGYQAAGNATTTVRALVIGSSNLFASTNVTDIQVLGTYCAYNAPSAGALTAIGNYAAYTATTISEVVAIGQNAAVYATSCSTSVCVGTNAGAALTGTMSACTFVGTLAGGSSPTAASLTAAIAIGYNAKVASGYTCSIGGTGGESVQVVINGSSATGQLDVNVNSASRVGLIVKGAASQSANLLELQNNSGTALTAFDKDAKFGVFAGFADGVNVAVGTSAGTKIGTATSQKLGFFNAAPVVQQSGNLVTALSNLGLVSGGTVTMANHTDYTGPADTSLSATVSFTAGAAPSGTATNRYAFWKIGKAVSLEVRLKYSVAGTAITGVDIDLPSDCPAPLDLTGVADGDMITAGTALFTTNLTSNTSSCRCILIKSSASATGYRVRVFGSSGDYTGCVISLGYAAA